MYTAQTKIISVFLFLVIAFLSSPASGFAQYFAENYWHNGKIFLENEQVLEGKIKYNLENEIVQLETNRLQTFTSRKVLSFQFYDANWQVERYFYNLPFAKVSNYETPTFFELLYQGEHVTLLCREDLVTQTFVNNNPYAWNPGMPITRTSVRSKFYFLFKNGKIRAFQGGKRELLYLLRDRERTLKKYLKEQRINYDSRPDMVRVIEYYNSIKVKE